MRPTKWVLRLSEAVGRRVVRTFSLCFAACIVLFTLPAVYFLTEGSLTPADDPAQAANRYLTAIYARDYPRAYLWISSEDQRHQDIREYLTENPPFSGTALELTYRLANRVKWHQLRSEVHGDHATVHFKVTLPDANAPPLQELFLDFDPERLSRLSGKEKREIENKLESMESQGTLPVIEGEDSLEMVKEDGQWRVVNHWGGAIRVRFMGEVKEGLAWEFRPVQEVLLAKPGETLQASYKAKNLSDRPITAKARHLNQPKGPAKKYLEIVQCFCFIQQTLAPGEEKEFPLVFRVHDNVPEELKEFSVNYQFYPIDKFPKQ